MKRVIKNKETGKYIIGRLLGENETSDKTKATIFDSLTQIKAAFGSEYKEDVDLEPLYLMCRDCKGSTKHTANKKQFLGCKNLVGIFPASSGFIICKDFESKPDE